MSAKSTDAEGPADQPITGPGRMGRFFLVGVAGFACDGGVLTLLVQFMGWSPYPARVVSFLFAATCTWMLNRSFAFSDRPTAQEKTARQYLSYLGAQTLGGAANMLVFALVVWRWPDLQTVVVVPLAIGSMAGAILNYLLLDRWVFKRRGQPTWPV